LNWHTCLWHIYPNIVLVEGVLICIKSTQLPTAFFHLPIPIHGRILLVAEHNAIAGLAFTGSFAALATYWLCFVAFELSLATGLAMIRQ